jgi:hypothetical protein
VEHGNEILISPCDSQLTRTYSEARAQSGELRKLAIWSCPFQTGQAAG